METLVTNVSFLSSIKTDYTSLADVTAGTTIKPTTPSALFTNLTSDTGIKAIFGFFGAFGTKNGTYFSAHGTKNGTYFSAHRSGFSSNYNFGNSFSNDGSGKFGYDGFGSSNSFGAKNGTYFSAHGTKNGTYFSAHGTKCEAGFCSSYT